MTRKILRYRFLDVLAGAVIGFAIGVLYGYFCFVLWK